MKYQTLNEVLKINVTWRCCHETIFQVRETKLTQERSCQVHTVLSGAAWIWTWEVKLQSPTPCLLPPSSICGQHEELYTIGTSSGHSMYWRHGRGDVMFGSESDLCTIRKARTRICEIVSVSAPASIYSNGCVNDFSPVFLESLKTKGIIYSFSTTLYCILWGKI